MFLLVSVGDVVHGVTSIDTWAIPADAGSRYRLMDLPARNYYIGGVQLPGPT